MDLLSILGLTPDAIQNQMAAKAISQPQPMQSSAPEDNSDWLSQLQAVSNGQPAQSAMPNSVQSSYAPTSGAKMEADSHSSIDDLLAKLDAQRNQYRSQDENQRWMTFFSRLAASKSPTLLGGLGEGAQGLTDAIGKQNANNQALDQQSLQDQIKYREWLQDQARQQQAVDQTGTYQQGELANRNAMLAQDAPLKKAQADYYANGAGAGNRAVSVIGPDGKPVLMTARDAMAQGYSPTAGYNNNVVTLSPEAIKMNADAVARGVPVGSLGLGNGSNANKAAVINQAQRDNPGLDLAGAQTELVGEKAGARTVGSTGGKIEFTSQSLGSMIPLAKQASAEIDRTQYPSINAIQNTVNQGTGDTKIIALNTYLNAVMADQASLFKRGGDSTDAAMAKAEKAANAAYTDGQLNAYFDSVEKEIGAQRTAGKNAMSMYTRKPMQNTQGETAMPNAPSKTIHFNDLPE